MSKVSRLPSILHPELADTKPKHHSFPLRLIALGASLINNAGLGRRTAIKVLQAIQLYVSDDLVVPSASSVRTWAIKAAKYNLTHSPTLTTKGDHWCIIIDISIRVGGQRLLLVLGVNLREYDHMIALSFSDVKVLALAIKKEKSWTAQAIVEVLKSQVLANFKVEYVVCDGGPNLRRAAKDLKLICIDDVSHAFARTLKSEYSQRSEFEQFVNICTAVRRANTINKHSHIRPPALRGTARFMNLGPLVNWAVNMLKLLDRKVRSRYKGREFTQLLRHKVSALLPLREFIMELHRTMDMLGIIMGGLKEEGITKKNVSWALGHLGPDADSRRISSFVYAKVKRYLNDQLDKCIALEKEVIICSTDIIESHFGKYKHTIGKAARSDYHCLQIAMYGPLLRDYSQINKAMEATRIIDLKDWHERVICPNEVNLTM